MVNFRGFKQLVAKVGGVWMDVDRRYFNDNTSGGERYATIDLQPGYQKLNGQKTLDFVRFRHIDNDLYRNARQQMFVRAFKQQVTHSFAPTSVPKIIDAITDNVQVAGGGKSKVSLEHDSHVCGLRLPAPARPFLPEPDRAGERLHGLQRRAGAHGLRDRDPAGRTGVPHPRRRGGREGDGGCAPAEAREEEAEWSAAEQGHARRAERQRRHRLGGERLVPARAERGYQLAAAGEQR